MRPTSLTVASSPVHRGHRVLVRGNLGVSATSHLGA